MGRSPSSLPTAADTRPWAAVGMIVRCLLQLPGGTHHSPARGGTRQGQRNADAFA